MATLVIDSLVDIEKATAVFSMKQSKVFLSFLPEVVVNSVFYYVLSSQS